MKLEGELRLNNKKILSILSSTAIFLSLNSSAFVVNAESQTLAELEQQQQELEEQSNQLSGEISNAEAQLNSLDAERQGLIEEIQVIQADIAETIAEIEAQEQEIARLEDEIEELTKEIEILQEKIEERDAILAAQARGIQTDASPHSIIDLILSAESLTDLIGKMEVVNLIVKNNNSIMEEQIRDQELVAEHKAQVDLAKEETIQVKEVMEENKANLETQKAALDEKVEYVSEKYNLTSSERDSLVSNQNMLANKASEVRNQITAEKNRIAAEKARIEAEQRRIAEEQAARAAAEAAAQAAAQAAAEKAAAERQKEVVTTSSNVSATPAPAATPAPTTNSGGWARPASGRVTSEYGNRSNPFTGGGGQFHSGIDIAGGGAITAAKSGTVTIAGYHHEFGNYVKIDHGGGLASLYAHMQPGLAVSVGQSVSQGQRLGTMGTTGYSTGVHLHFEVHQNGRRVNPRNFVNF